jgi:hypothetical protein
MRSSDTSDDADSLFPSELDPPGSSSQHLDGGVGLAASTPPQSQDLNNDVMDTQEAGETRELGQGQGGMSAFAQSAMGQESSEPGACWNNKKARDEMQRAMMQIEDKGFSLSGYSYHARDCTPNYVG